MLVYLVPGEASGNELGFQTLAQLRRRRLRQKRCLGHRSRGYRHGDLLFVPTRRHGGGARQRCRWPRLRLWGRRRWLPGLEPMHPGSWLLGQLLGRLYRGRMLCCLLAARPAIIPRDVGHRPHAFSHGHGRYGLFAQLLLSSPSIEGVCGPEPAIKAWKSTRMLIESLCGHIAARLHAVALGLELQLLFQALLLAEVLGVKGVPCTWMLVTASIPLHGGRASLPQI